jgi:hypothetical protein
MKIKKKDNFYIENYKKYLFLTRLVLRISSSKITCLFRYNSLETVREVLFVGLMVYSQIVILRIALSWYIYINRILFLGVYLAAAVDWTEDVLKESSRRS